MVAYQAMSEDTDEEAMRTVKAFQDELETLSQQFTKLHSMESVLQQDVLDHENLINGENKTESSKRSFVRAVFALIEGSVFNLKEVALNVSVHKPTRFSKAELAMLEEVSYELNDKGETKTQVKFIPLTKNMRFAFDTAARAFNVSYTLVVDDEGWSKFRDALILRNRITHPKQIDDLQLSDDEVQVVADTATWFLNNQHTLFQLFVDKMQRLAEFLDTRKPTSPPSS